MNPEEALRARLVHFGARAFARGRPNRFASDIRRGFDGVPAIISALAAADFETRIDALRALAVMHDRGLVTDSSLEYLIRFAAQRSTVDEEMMWTLIALGRARIEPLMTGFVRMLGEPDSARVTGAGYALGGGRWRPALAALIDIVHRASGGPASAAIWALGQLGDPEGLPVLHRALAQGRFVQWIPGALGDIGALVSLDVLMPVLFDQRPNVRFLAAAAMFEIVRRHAGHDLDLERRRFEVPLNAAWNRSPRDRAAGLILVTLANLGARIDPERVRITFGVSGSAT